MCRPKELSLGGSFVLVALLGSAAPQPPAFLRLLLIPQPLSKWVLFRRSFSSFFGIQETCITHSFQLTIKLGEQEHKRKHVYVQLALLQRRGLDVPDLFSAISSWPSPNFSPSSLCRACCWLGTAAWRSCLRAPLPLPGSPKSSGLLLGCTKLIIKISGVCVCVGREDEGGFQVHMPGEKERLRNAGALASLCCALQL